MSHRLCSFSLSQRTNAPIALRPKGSRQLTGTGPFRIHPGDTPFTPPNHPWPSPNNTDLARSAAAKGNAAEAAPVANAPRTPHAETIGPMVDEAHNMICFVLNLPGGFTGASYHLPAFYELWAR
jgi:oligosaccharide reducing-end xylanase